MKELLLKSKPEEISTTYMYVDNFGVTWRFELVKVHGLWGVKYADTDILIIPTYYSQIEFSQEHGCFVTKYENENTYGISNINGTVHCSNIYTMKQIQKELAVYSR